MTVSTGNTLNTLDTLIAFVTLFAVGNGEGGGSAVGVGDGVSIYKTACAGLFDFCYCRSKLCIDGFICIDSITEIKFGGKIAVCIPTDQNLACKCGCRGCNGFAIQNRLGFTAQCAVVKCNHQCRFISDIRICVVLRSESILCRDFGIGFIVTCIYNKVSVKHRDPTTCHITTNKCQAAVYSLCFNVQVASKICIKPPPFIAVCTLYNVLTGKDNTEVVIPLYTKSAIEILVFFIFVTWTTILEIVKGKCV